MKRKPLSTEKARKVFKRASGAKSVNHAPARTRGGRRLSGN